MTIMKLLPCYILALLLHIPFAEAQPYPLGFTAADINEVYSDEFVIEGSKKWPVSRDTCNQVFTWNQAGPDLKMLYGEFKFLGDSKGYIHVGRELNQDHYEQLQHALTDLSNYTELESGGKPLFQEIMAVDKEGRPITSSFISNNSTKNTMYAMVQVVTQGVRINVMMQINILEADDGLTLELFNLYPVRYGLLGQIFDTKDFYVRVDFAAFDRGWLFRGISKFNPSPFLANMIKDPTTLAYGGQVLNWLEPYVVEPLPR